MRTVILKMVLSLDGFATSPDGSHDWMFEFFDDDSMARNLAALDAAAVHVMGRRSYDVMGPYWTASDGPVATSMNTKPKAVFSRTLTDPGWGPTEVFGDVAAGIAELKQRDDDGTVLIHGGPTLARAVVALGLVDVFHLSTVPVAIGQGRSPFDGLAEPLRLEVVEEQRFRLGGLAQVLVPRA